MQTAVTKHGRTVIPAAIREYHVSPADAVIAAFALQHHAVLIHKDPEFEAPAGFLSMETLPYKAK
jgi:predicted nucleic acid-binding protein